MAWEVKKSRMGFGSMKRPWIIVDDDLNLTYLDITGERPQRFKDKEDAEYTAKYLNFQRQLGNDLS